MGLFQPSPHFNALQTMRLTHQAHVFSDLQNTDHGSIIVELSTSHLSNQAHKAICCKGGISEYFQLDLFPSESRIVVLVGAKARHIDIPLCHIPLDQLAKLRITFSWSQPENISLLTAECLSSGQIYQAEINCAVPVSAALLKQLHATTQDTQIASSVSFVGVSGRREPVGIALSISHGALIETPTAHMPVQHLKIGDMVQTLDNGLQPVRWIGSQIVPSVGAYCPIELRAPYHGLTRTVFLHPKQRILMENSNVEYLFGADSALIEARHLLDNVSAICLTNTEQSHRLYHILFDNHEIINVSGCYMESLFIGNIADDPSLLKTTVLGTTNPATLPRHTQKARPFLQHYEAMILRSEMQQ